MRDPLLLRLESLLPEFRNLYTYSPDQYESAVLTAWDDPRTTLADTDVALALKLHNWLIMNEVS